MCGAFGCTLAQRRLHKEAFRKRLSNNLERGSGCNDVYARVCANDVFASVLPKTKIAPLIPVALHTNLPLSIAPSLLDRRRLPFFDLDVLCTLRML